MLNPKFTLPAVSAVALIGFFLTSPVHAFGPQDANLSAHLFNVSDLVIVQNQAPKRIELSQPLADQLITELRQHGNLNQVFIISPEGEVQSLGELRTFIQTIGLPVDPDSPDAGSPVNPPSRPKYPKPSQDYDKPSFGPGKGGHERI